jgi:N-acetylmuramoyl-L-alanine amidase
MATVRPRRALLAALIVLVSAIALVVGPPGGGSSSAAPATVVRSAAIDAGSLASAATTLSASGVLRANASHGAAAARTTAARSNAVTACAPIWFDGLAVTWEQAGGRPMGLSVATGPGRSAIGAAQHLDAEGGPDPGTAEARAARMGSDYVWTGGSRCARIRLDVPSGAAISSVRVVYLNTGGTAAGPGTGPPDVGPALDGVPPVQPANAATREPRFITRAEWGANPKMMNCTPDVVPYLTNAFVHHTAGSNGYSRSHADDVVRGIFAYHTQVRGWCDIGYNFLVDRYGDVFIGRSGGITNDVVGAAQMGFNRGAFSVSMMGTFDTVAPPPVAIHALERLLAWRLDVAHVNPLGRHSMTSSGGSTTRYTRGTTVRLHAISGHRDTGLTDCPGGRLYRLLPTIRRVVARIGLPKIYAPRASTAKITASETTAIRVRARGSATLRWSVSVLDASGAVVWHTRPPRDDRFSIRWDATLDAPGRYRIEIDATDHDGRPARAAVLPLFVRIAPSPSPSPSPTTTPSPTASPT